MAFNSPLFLCYFMPAVLALVLIAPRSWRNGVVAVGSAMVYERGAGAMTLLLLSCIVVNYVAGPALEPDPWDLSRTQRQRLLMACAAFNVAMLVVWKYAGFATAQAAVLASLFGSYLPVVHLALPIGI